MKLCATSLVPRAVFSTGERLASLSQRLWAMSGDGCDCHRWLGGCLWHVGKQLHFPQCNRTALHANCLTSDVRSNKGETALERCSSNLSHTAAHVNGRKGEWDGTYCHGGECRAGGTSQLGVSQLCHFGRWLGRFFSSSAQTCSSGSTLGPSLSDRKAHVRVKTHAGPDLTAVCAAAGTRNSSCVLRLWMEEPPAVQSHKETPLSSEKTHLLTPAVISR